MITEKYYKNDCSHFICGPTLNKCRIKHNGCEGCGHYDGCKEPNAVMITKEQFEEMEKFLHSKNLYAEVYRTDCTKFDNKNCLYYNIKQNSISKIHIGIRYSNCLLGKRDCDKCDCFMLKEFNEIKTLEAKNKHLKDFIVKLLEE